MFVLRASVEVAKCGRGEEVLKVKLVKKVVV